MATLGTAGTDIICGVCAGGALESCQSEVLDSSRPACGEGPALGRVAARWNNAQAAAELS